MRWAQVDFAGGNANKFQRRRMWIWATRQSPCSYPGERLLTWLIDGKEGVLLSDEGWLAARWDHSLHFLFFWIGTCLTLHHPFPSAPRVRVQHIDVRVHWRVGNKNRNCKQTYSKDPRYLLDPITQELNCSILLLFREREKVEGGVMRGQVRWSQVYFADGRGIPIPYIRKKFSQI